MNATGTADPAPPGDPPPTDARSTDHLDDTSTSDAPLATQSGGPTDVDLPPDLPGELAAELPGGDAPGGGPVRDVLQGWLAGFLLAQRSAHTRRAYHRDVTAWLAWCAAHHLSPTSAARGHVDAYLRELDTLPQPATGRPLSPATVARRVAALAGFYDYGLTHHHGELAELGLTASPLERIPRPRIGDDTQALGLTRPALQALLVAAEYHSPRAHALVALLVHTGLRIDEALARDVEDWRNEAGHEVLEVRRKGGFLGVTVLSPPVQGALRRYLAGRTRGPVFVTGSGRRLDQPGAWRLVRALARAAQLPDAERVNPHALRHSFVTMALDAGVALRDVQDAAGHTDPATTRRYDRARHPLDRHATYAVTAHLAAPA